MALLLAQLQPRLSLLDKHASGTEWQPKKPTPACKPFAV